MRKLWCNPRQVTLPGVQAAPPKKRPHQTPPDAMQLACPMIESKNGPNALGGTPGALNAKWAQVDKTCPANCPDSFSMAPGKTEVVNCPLLFSGKRRRATSGELTGGSLA